VKLGVISDTHGNLNLMFDAAGILTHDLGAERLFHLGDDYADAVTLAKHFPGVAMVPGLWCAAYQDPCVPKRLLERIDGLTVASAHADKDLRAVERAADVILTGHSHQAQAALLGRSLYVNPGHLTAHISRGEVASFALIEADARIVRAVIYSITGMIRHQISIERNRLGSGKPEVNEEDT
jgi:uncharacterized protein